MNKISTLWDQRYSNNEYVYGENPNEYFKDQLAKLLIGRILFAGEGEGRNAVYAAKQGWEVSAYDISVEGKKKALQLAFKNNVYIDYHVGELHQLSYETEQFDVIVLIYTHFSSETRTDIHKVLTNYLRPGGTIILEAFSKRHTRYQAINPNAGGPKNVNVLYAVEDIKLDFQDFEIAELNETEIHLNEGRFHNGLSSVIRFTGKKNCTIVDFEV